MSYKIYHRQIKDKMKIKVTLNQMKTVILASMRMILVKKKYLLSFRHQLHYQRIIQRRSKKTYFKGKRHPRDYSWKIPSTCHRKSWTTRARPSQRKRIQNSIQPPNAETKRKILGQFLSFLFRAFSFLDDMSVSIAY